MQASFSLVLHKKDLRILYSIKKYFRVGNVFSRKDDTCVYLVQSVKDLAVIIDHFDKYPLITQKQADYLLFKMAVSLINNKEHLKEEGLRKILAIKASLNRGLPLNIKAAFLDTIPYPRPSVLDFKIKDPN
jgi:sRNA-binding regulator protein Hfq